MKAAAHPQTDWKTKCPPKYLQGLLNGVAVLFFPRGADAAVGWEEYSGCVANSTMARFAVSGYALRAHQTRTMKIGDITRGKRVLRAIFASLQWRNIRSAKRCWPRVLRGTAITPAQWNVKVSLASGLSLPVLDFRRLPKHFERNRFCGDLPHAILKLFPPACFGMVNFPA